MHEFTPELSVNESEQIPVVNSLGNHVETEKLSRGPFAKLPNAVARNREIDPQELVFIAWRAGYISWICDEAAILKEGLVKPRTGFQKNSLREAMKRAKNHGFLKREQVNRPGHYGHVVETFDLPLGADGYSEVPRSWFDGTLSVKALAARIFLNAGTGRGPATYARELRERFGWHLDTTQKVLDELRDAGHVPQKPLRDAQGQFTGAVQQIDVPAKSEKPGNGKIGRRKNRATANTGNGKTGQHTKTPSYTKTPQEYEQHPNAKQPPAAVHCGENDLSISGSKADVCDRSPSETKPSRAYPRRHELVDCEIKILADHVHDFMQTYPFSDKSGWYEQSRAEFERIVFAESTAEGCYFVDVAARILDAAIEYRNKQPKCPRNPYQWLKNKGYLHVDSVEARGEPTESVSERRARALGLLPKKETHLQRRARLMGLTPSAPTLDLVATVEISRPKKSSYEEIMDVLNGDEEL